MPADVWQELLAPATLGGVEFPVRARAFSGGRDFARITPAHFDGQLVDDRGRKAIIFRLRVELWADVNETHYPGIYDQLLEVFARPDREIEYQDPVLGPFPVKIAQFEVEEDAEQRNGASISITLEEITAEGATAFILPERSPARASTEARSEERRVGKVRGARRQRAQS